MHIKYTDYSNLFGEKGFGGEIIDDIIQNITELVCEFCQRQIDYYFETYGLHITINYDALKAGQAIVDTLEDLTRLKEFHALEYPNKLKCAAYLSYWWLQRQPISLMLPEGEEEKLLSEASDEDICRFIHANAFWTLTYSLGLIFTDKERECAKNEEFQRQWEVEFDYMFYVFCYRAISPKSIEGMLSTAVVHPIWEVAEGVYFEE